MIQLLPLLKFMLLLIRLKQEKVTDKTGDQGTRKVKIISGELLNKWLSLIVKLILI